MGMWSGLRLRLRLRLRRCVRGHVLDG
jgi:hypothetical protein